MSLKRSHRLALLSCLATFAIADVARASHAVPPVNLVQRNGDGTALCIGCTTVNTSVQITADSDTPTCGGTMTLQIEVRLVGVAFSGVATHSSASVAKPNCALQQYPTTTIAGLAPGSYHWQVREGSSGVYSAWVPYNGGLTAFVVGAGSQINVAPGALNFGSLGIGSSSAPQNVTLSSVGMGTLQIKSLVVSGPFSISAPNTPYNVAPGNSSVVTVTFSPNVPGPAAGMLTITSDANNSPAVTVAISGTGTTGVVSLFPPTIDFGTLPLGVTSSPSTVTLSNVGMAPLVVSGVSTAPPFDVLNVPGVPFTVQPNSQVTFQVTFTPAQVGTLPGTVIISSNDVNSPTSYSVVGTGVTPGLMGQPNPLGFGAITIVGNGGGQGTSKVLTVASNVNQPITISQITVMPGAPEWTIDNLPVLPLTLGPLGSVPLIVSFKPQGHGARMTTIVVTSDAPNSPLSVPVSGTGVGPRVGAQPNPLAFGPVTVGQSALATLTVSNQGETPMRVATLAMSGANAADFASLTAVPFMVQAGSSNTVVVRFKPGAAGPRSAKVTIVTDDQLSPTLDVALTGLGANGQLVLKPNALDFGSAVVGAQTAPLPLAITNMGNGPLSVSGITLGGMDAASFQLSAPALPLVIPAGATRTVAPVFAPRNVGPATAQLTLVTDDPMAPNVVVPLKGVGLGAAVSLDPSMVDFGSLLVGRMSGKRDVMVHNGGTAALTLSALSLSGPQGGSFSLVNPPRLPVVIAPGGAQAVAVQFTPPFAGMQAATLVVVTDDVKSPLAMAQLSGTGLSQYLSVSPLTVDFGSVRAGATSAPHSITLQNVGPEPLALMDGVLGGATGNAFTVESAQAMLMPGQQKAVAATFTPPATGDFSATLTFRTADQALPPVVVKLVGQGAATRISVSPGTLDFGNVGLGEAPVRALSVTNVSDKPLTIGKVTSSDMAFTVQGADKMMLLQPGEKTSYNVELRPSKVGAAMGRVEVFLDGVFSAEAVVPLSANAVDAQLPDGGGDMAVPAGCGCVVGGGATGGHGALVVMALIAMGLVRRRRMRVGVRKARVASLLAGVALLGAGGVAQALPKVAVLAAGPTGGDLQAKLLSTGAFQSVDVINVSGSTPSVPVLGGYDVVAVYSQQAFQSAQALGDNLATYLEGGGGVVLFDWGALEQGASALAGRYAATYSLMNTQAQGQVSLAAVSLGNVVENAGLTAGVRTFACRGTCHHLTSQPRPGAVVVARWSDGSPLILRGSVAGRTVVELNFLPVSTSVMGGEWDPFTDGALLVRNALLYAIPQALRPGRSTLSYNDTPVGQAQAQTLTFTNGGNAPIAVGTVTLTGPDAGDFQVFPSATLPRTVAPGASFDVAVDFVPLQAGPRAATVSLGVVSATATVDVLLSGNGLASSFTVSPPVMNLGSVGVGASVKASFTVRNQTGGAANLNGLVVTQNNAEFVVTPALQMPVNLQAGGSFTFTVEFRPLVGGTRFGTAVITPDQGLPFAVPLVGTAGVAVIVPGNGVLFTGTHVGSITQPQMLTIGNSGLAALQVSSIVLGGAAPGDFALTLPQLPIVIPPNGSASYQVAFRPMTPGQRSAIVTLVNNDPDNSAATVTVVGTGVAFAQTVSPMQMDFGLVRIHSTSMPQVGFINNKSGAPLLVKKVSIAGPQAALFNLMQAPADNTPLPAGASLSASVTFKPTLPAAATALLVFQIDDPDSPTMTIALRGLGSAGALGVAPLSIDFGGVPTGKSSAAQLVTVRNNGSATLNVRGIDFTGADATSFSAPDRPGLPSLLGPGASLTFNAVYTPAGHVKAEAQLVITSDDPLAPTAAIALVAAGTLPSLVLATPATVNLGVAPLGTMTRPVSVTLRNAGDEKLILDTLELSGAGMGAFRMEGPMAPAPIDPGGTLTMQVRFAPAMGMEGAAAATLTAASRDGRLMPVTVQLAGTGSAMPIGLSATTFDFGLVTLMTRSDPQTVTINNTSGAAITLGPIASDSAAFTVGTSATTQTLAAGASTTFTVTFAPPGIDQVSGKVTLSLESVPGTVVGTVELTGQGAAPRTTQPGGMGATGCAIAGGSRDAPAAARLPMALALLVGGLVLRRRARRR